MVGIRIGGSHPRRRPRLMTMVATAAVVAGGLAAVGATPAAAASHHTSFQPHFPQSTGRLKSMLPGGARVSSTGEIPTMRTADSDTFLTHRGLQTKVFTSPINYQSNGSWQPIDTTLKPSKVGWAPKASGTALRLPRTLAQPVSLGSAGRHLSTQLEGASAQAVGKVSGSTVSYPNVLPGVQVVDRATTTGLKESLILQSRKATRRLFFDVGLPHGASGSISRGALAVRNSSGEVLWRLPAPTVSDARGTLSAAAVWYGLARQQGRLRLSVNVSKTWLYSKRRAFPVVVDPTAAPSDNGDTYIEGGSLANSNFNTTTPECVGYDSTHSTYARTLLSFDAVDVLPPGSQGQILNASVGIDPSSATGTTTVGTYGLTKTWTPAGATWNSRDGSNNWTSAGGDFTSTAYGSQTLTSASTAGYQFIDVTPLVQHWINQDSAQDGVLLKATTETTSDGYVCFPTDTGPNGPFLSVYWQSRTGDEPYYTYKSYPIDDHETLKVNVGTGNVLVESTDEQVDGVGQPLAITRTYNSGAGPYALYSPIGYNWDTAPGYNTGVINWADNNSLTYLDPSGAAYTFTIDPVTGNYDSPPGIHADMETEPGGWKLVSDGGGLVEHFSGTTGELSSYSDNNGNAITLNGAIGSGAGPTSLTDTEGRSYSYSVRSSSPGFGYYGTLSDPASRTVTYGYTTATDGQTELTSVTDQNSQTVHYGYDSNDSLNSITTPAGRSLSITYGTNTVEVCRSDPHTSTTPCDTYTFNTGSSPTTTLQDADGHSTTYTVDPDEGKVTKTTDADSRSRSTSYTGNDDIHTLTDNLSNVTTYGYDTQNRITSLQAPTDSGGDTNAKTTVGYSGSGNSSYWPAAATDPQGNCTKYGYDASGNLETAVSGQTAGTSSSTCTSTSTKVTTTTNYQGDSGVSCGAKTGEVCSTVDGRGETTSYSYDTHGNLSQISPPAPLSAATYSIDSSTNLLTSTTDGNGNTTKYFYDGLGRVTETRYDGGTATTCSTSDASAGKCIGYTYDADGNLTSRVDNTGTTNFFYDGLGRPVEERFDTSSSLTCSSTDANAGKCIGVTYDQAGNVTSYIDAGGTVTYSYDPANLLTSLAEPGGSCPSSKCTQFTYDNDGREHVITYPSGESVTYGYDNGGRMNAITQKYANGTTGFSRTIVYAKSGADTGLEQSQTDNGTTTTYTYDGFNQLHTAAVGSTTYTYNYDADGDRTNYSKSGSSTNYYGYNNADQLCWSATTSGSIPSPGSACTSNPGPSGATDYRYDGAGNLCWTASSTGSSYTCSSAPSGATQYIYNSKEQNTSIGSTSFVYADQGQSLRTSSTTSGTSTSEVNGLLGLAGQTVGSGTPVYFTRTPSGQLISLRQGAGSSSTNSYYLIDQLGSVVALTDGTGNSNDASYTYDPYGNTVSASGSIATLNPYRFATGYLDATSGLLKLGTRYYNASLGRFSQMDPAGGGYLYASDDPANRTDPSGQSDIGWSDGPYGDVTAQINDNGDLLIQFTAKSRALQAYVVFGIAVEGLGDSTFVHMRVENGFGEAVVHLHGLGPSGITVYGMGYDAETHDFLYEMNPIELYHDFGIGGLF